MNKRTNRFPKLKFSVCESNCLRIFSELTKQTILKSKKDQIALQKYCDVCAHVTERQKKFFCSRVFYRFCADQRFKCKRCEKYECCPNCCFCNICGVRNLDYYDDHNIRIIKYNEKSVLNKAIISMYENTPIWNFRNYRKFQLICHELYQKHSLIIKLIRELIDITDDNQLNQLYKFEYIEQICKIDPSNKQYTKRLVENSDLKRYLCEFSPESPLRHALSKIKSWYAGSLALEAQLRNYVCFSHIYFDSIYYEKIAILLPQLFKAINFACEDIEIPVYYLIHNNGMHNSDLYLDYTPISKFVVFDMIDIKDKLEST